MKKLSPLVMAWIKLVAAVTAAVVYVWLNSAHAASFGVHIGTYHFDRSTKYKEFNPGVYMRNGPWVAGVYENSKSRTSVYGAYSYNITPRISVQAGLVSGYNKSVMPLVTMSFCFGRPVVVLIPNSPKGGSGGLHLAYEVIQ